MRASVAARYPVDDIVQISLSLGPSDFQSRFVPARTAQTAQRPDVTRAFLLERGMVFAKTPAKLKLAMPEILENVDANLTLRMRNLVSLLWNEWKDMEQQIVAMNAEVEQIAASDPGCQRLRQIPGIGSPLKALFSPVENQLLPEIPAFRLQIGTEDQLTLACEHRFCEISDEFALSSGNV
jgi:hypothetical protein